MSSESTIGLVRSPNPTATPKRQLRSGGIANDEVADDEVASAGALSSACAMDASDKNASAKMCVVFVMTLLTIIPRALHSVPRERVQKLCKSVIAAGT